jgi:hypothetical protein
MEKPARRVKKVAKKSLLNTGKLTEQAEKRVPAIPISISTNWQTRRHFWQAFRDELAGISATRRNSWTTSQRTRRAFRPMKTMFRSLTTAHALLYVPGQADSSSPDYEFGGEVADDAPMAGQKRRPNSPEDELSRFLHEFHFSMQIYRMCS